MAIGNGSGNGHRPKIAERVASVGDKTRSSQAWNSIFRPGSIYRKGYTDSPRNRSYVIMNNVLYHLHPVKVKRHAVKVSYTLCLGGLSFFLFILLTVTGIFLMFFYRPTVTDAYANVQNLETAVAFGSLVTGSSPMASHARGYSSSARFSSRSASARRSMGPMRSRYHFCPSTMASDR